MKVLWKTPPLEGPIEELHAVHHGGRRFESVMVLTPIDQVDEIFISMFFKDVVRLDITYLYAITAKQVETGLDCLLDLGDSHELAALNDKIRADYRVKEPYFQYRLHFMDGPCYDIVAQDWAVRSSSPRVAQHQKDPEASWVRNIRPWTSREGPPIP